MKSFTKLALAAMIASVAAAGSANATIYTHGSNANVGGPMKHHMMMRHHGMMMHHHKMHRHMMMKKGM